ncbi:hydroxymethylpyrimidine/phosphomethylpyrimidine kinase [Galliscardovia ingluviei]|uniref:Hydroxymethylpyrimidine/phosphomethylpyrimidine kinase n=1 Tax=Galliscardovia ingluviei TaxID=1769422 RepID=A0A8J3AFV6_9BIFI|nr:bifunctional hydroxymethylpyrimidine kinase/phosphomethylpyrimidine kinase [Galliscardovia ingluviei]GGI13124.1 hydroxymethylpyrimidine/phosphomethylpyrimidine kinase [Galliscardovia ingluviei]
MAILIPVLSIAGSDCSGGAGIQADLKTISALGCFAMSVVTSVVAENTARVISVMDVSDELIRDQMEAVFTDIPPKAVKIGMLNTPTIMRAVATGLDTYQPEHVVIDPVMVAKNGAPLMQPSSMQELITTIIPRASVLTPNIPEAEQITGMQIQSVADQEAAGRAIIALGCKAVLVKGGHSTGEAIDVLVDNSTGKITVHQFAHARIQTKNTHGTGCTLSSAIATGLAQGMNTVDAVARAKRYVTMAIEHALELGEGNGPTHHFYDVYEHGLRAI